MTLQKQIEKILSAEKRDETWYEFFDRLNDEGRLDTRAIFYGMAVILDYLDDAPWDTKIPSFDPAPTLPKTSKKAKTKKK